MKTMTELNAGDIRRIIAQHLGIDESQITVSPRARVRFPGEAETRTETAPEPQAPEEAPAAPEPEKPAKQHMSRVERIFGRREEWSSAPAQQPETEAEEQTVRPVKGFLIIKCRSCGSTRSFFLKDYASATRCPGCGAEIPLDGNLLRPVYMQCPHCENALKYKTNFTGERIELNCKRCGAPVDLELNGRGTAYNTIK